MDNKWKIFFTILFILILYGLYEMVVNENLVFIEIAIFISSVVSLFYYIKNIHK